LHCTLLPVFLVFTVERWGRHTDPAVMSRIGLTPDELAATWSGHAVRGYVARVAGLNVLAGETIALVGTGVEELLELLMDAIPRCTVVDGANAAAGGTLRIHAQQAARVGVEAIAITDPFAAASLEARDLAVADLAGLRNLGVTTVVAVTDADLGAAFADRVAVVRDGQVVVAYPVVAPTPRAAEDIAPVSRRIAHRLATTG
jgi:hypothetical protein